MKFKSVVWSSTIDFPNEVSTVLFVGTCNWDCEYCYNKSLNNKEDIDFETQILPRLIDRKDFINHIVISGGECTIYPELEKTIDILKENGFKVGIHTNGSNPKILRRILPKLDFVGMDIKTHYMNYLKITSLADTIQIHTSICLINESGVKSEFRTTLYPEYINNINCNVLAKQLKQFGVKKWILQEYTNGFNPSLVNPYDKSYVQNIVNQCNQIIPTKLKGESYETENN